MKYFNVTQEEIDNRMFNIFVGISLGNKLLTPDLARHYIEWAHKNTRDNAIVLIADKIDTVNWEVFRGLSPEDALEKVKNKGYAMSGMFDRARRTLAKETGDMGYISRVHIVFWDDVMNKGYYLLREIIADKYKTNDAFRDGVLYFVNKYIEIRQTKVSEEDKDRLAGYIIDELPKLRLRCIWTYSEGGTK